MSEAGAKKKRTVPDSSQTEDHPALFNFEADMGNVLWSLIWLLVLIFISFFVAGFCAFWYILLLPFTVCIGGLASVTDFLLKCVQFPHYCAESMVAGRSL